MVGAGPRRRAGVDAVRVGRARRRSIPRRCTLRDRARPRVERDGDPWADIADDPQSLEPLLEMHDRDIASGLQDAPWPPVYPKMPGEPPRVAPSRKKADPD